MAGKGSEAACAPALVEAIRSVVERWPMPRDPIRGRSVGHELRSTLVRVRRGTPSAADLLRRMLLSLATPVRDRGERQRRPSSANVPIETPLFNARDRRAIVLGLLGTPTLFFRSELQGPRTADRPSAVHVYLDTSQSTAPYHGDLVAAVRPHVERGRAVAHAFSERIAPLDLADLGRGKLETTRGTNIACVTEHMLQHRIVRAIVLTDGYVGKIPVAHQRKLAARRARLDVALTPEGWRGDLISVTRRFVVLPLRGGRDES